VLREVNLSPPACVVGSTVKTISTGKGADNAGDLSLALANQRRARDCGQAASTRFASVRHDPTETQPSPSVLVECAQPTNQL